MLQYVEYCGSLPSLSRGEGEEGGYKLGLVSVWQNPAARRLETPPTGLKIRHRRDAAANAL
ncbi:hypothetical protein NKDENANG_00545 [Candidatus Entotheonellaceae bacterium PAL068K]